MRFRTHIDRVLDDIELNARKVLDQAYKDNDGWFVLAVSTIEEDGSNEQNNTWHALLDCYWESGLSSYQSYEDMRDKLKLRIKGAKEIMYLDSYGRSYTVKSIADVPLECAGYVEIPYSWREFSKKQRMQMIDHTIADMVQAGVASKKFDEIMEGLGQ